VELSQEVQLEILKFGGGTTGGVGVGGGGREHGFSLSPLSSLKYLKF